MNQTNISDLWTLENEGTTLTAGGAGVTDIVRRRESARTETCTLQRAGQPFDAPPLFPLGSRVVVRRGGAPWFVGRAVAAPGSGDGCGEESALVLAGPWWFLENLVYRQRWTLAGGADGGLSSRVVLGQGEGGARLTAGETLAQIAQYAVDAGAPWRVGTVEGDVTLPLDELRNVTCAQAMRRVLRWLPDQVAWFDHASTPAPTFHCRARFNLPEVTLRVGEAPLTAVRGITVRPPGHTPAVVLHYETRTEDGGVDLLTDAAPPEATGAEFGALVATIPAQAAGAGEGTGEMAGSFRSVAELPTGAADASLAGAMLDARAAATHSGRVELTEAEAGGTALGPGTTLNLEGSARPEWATMHALVVEDETAVATGRSVVRFGSTESEEEGEGLAEALRTVQPGIVGREAGSPAAAWTRGSAERSSGRAGR